MKTFRAPSRWSVLAILAFAAPILAIAIVQYRWLLELRSRSEVIAAQQNREAAQRAVDVLESEMTAARLQVLPPVGHADLLAMQLDPVGEVFENAGERFGYVDRYFVWTESMSKDDALFYEPDLGGFVPDPARLARLPQQVWNWHPEYGKGRWAEFPCAGVGPPRCQVVLHLILDDDERELIAVAGFLVDVERFAKEFLPRFTADVLGPAVRELLDEDVELSVLDDEGLPIVGEERAKQSTAPSVELPVSFSLPSEGLRMMSSPLRWRVSVASGDEDLIPAMLRRGVIGNLAIVGVGILALTAAWGLVAWSSVREAKLSDLKSRFISGISHELKTPLSMIRLYSEMLELGRVPNHIERKLFYRSLRQQAEIMNDMLEEILDFSRLESEQQSTRMETCSVKEILEGAVSMRDWQARTPHEVDVKLGSELPEIRGNRSALVRVVYSLLDNASKYSGPNEPISVEAERRNGMVAIEVIDRGRGIAAEDLPHLFERFYRGQTSEGVKGTGLGLSIVQSVVKSHGGRVEVESEPGKGSRFTVLLPVTSNTTDQPDNRGG